MYVHTVYVSEVVVMNDFITQINQENDAESLRTKVRKLQGELAEAEDTISSLESQVRKGRTTASKRPKVRSLSSSHWGVGACFG